MTDPDPLQIASESFQASGFPFQIAVEGIVASTDRWRVCAREFPWTHPDGSDQFLDLVATNGEVVVGIECKKTTKEVLTFLAPEPHSAAVLDVVSLHAIQIPDSTQRMEVDNELWSVSPDSIESAFCIVSTSASGRDQRLLERDARLVVRGVDAFALSAKRRFHPSKPLLSRVLYIPAIVTNAPLFTVSFRPDEVPLDTGSLRPGHDRLVSAPWVRFRKHFVSDGGSGVGERTVLVVQAAFLSTLLATLSPHSSQATFGRLYELRSR